MTDREPGFYWVREGEHWVVAELAHSQLPGWEEGFWTLTEFESPYRAQQFDEIGPRIDRDETERLKARVAELEAALRDGYFAICHIGGYGVRSDKDAIPALKHMFECICNAQKAMSPLGRPLMHRDWPKVGSGAALKGSD